MHTLYYHPSAIYDIQLSETIRYFSIRDGDLEEFLLRLNYQDVAVNNEIAINCVRYLIAKGLLDREEIQVKFAGMEPQQFNEYLILPNMPDYIGINERYIEQVLMYTAEVDKKKSRKFENIFSLGN